MSDTSRSAVDLYWLPVGAGGHSVRLNGRIFEAVVSRLERRPARDLYHSALVVSVPAGEFVIETAPIPDGSGVLRGVVAEGAVGSRFARPVRIFRYELRCWRDGVIPDLDEAVESPQRLTEDTLVARRLLELVPAVPMPVWGRDELHAGEMWNSNSVVSWLLVRSGVDLAAAHLPAGGRAPGWRAGVVVARRDGMPAGVSRRARSFDASSSRLPPGRRRPREILTSAAPGLPSAPRLVERRREASRRGSAARRMLLEGVGGRAPTEGLPSMRRGPGNTESAPRLRERS